MSTAIYPREFSVIYPALKLAGEAGEVAEKIGKRIRDADADFSDEKWHLEMGKELGDVLWYVAAIAHDLNIPLDVVAIANIAKLSSRKERGVLQGSGDNR